MSTTETARAKKSEKLAAEEYKALVKWVNKQDTQIDAAEIIGITREVLGRVLIVKSGSPATIAKVRLVLPKDDGADAPALA